MEKVFGCDLSVYQKGINLSKAKSEGVEFVILRAGYTGYGDGISKAKDAEFEIHYRNAKNNGLGVGAYWFSRATTYKNGRLEAEYMYENCLKDKQFEYPIYIDVEDGYYQSKASKTELANAIKGFCEYLESKGYYVGIYANVDWFRNRIDTDSLNKYDKWVASWGVEKPIYPDGGMWQFGGETNKIRTNKIANMICDQNYSFKDYPTIIKNAGLNGFSKNTINNTPVTPKVENKPTTSENTKGYTTYTVQKGDTLSEIGKKHNVDWKVIAKDNNINPPKYTIYVGQTIKISANGKVSTKTYTVQKGDNLSKIAKKYNTSWQKLASDNNLKGPKYTIYPGQKLVIN